MMTRTVCRLLALLFLVVTVCANKPAWAQKGRLFARVKIVDGTDELPPGRTVKEKLFLVDTGAKYVTMKRAAAIACGFLTGAGAVKPGLKSADKICTFGADTKIGTVCTANADCNTMGQTDGRCSDMIRVNVGGKISTMQISKPLKILAKGLKQVDTTRDGNFNMKMDKNVSFVELGTDRVLYPKKTSGDYFGGNAFPMNAVGLLGLSFFDLTLKIQKRDSGIQFVTFDDRFGTGRGLVPLTVTRNDDGVLVSLSINDVALETASGDFAIVTGSAVSLISSRLAEQLGIPPSDEVLLQEEDPFSLAALSSDGFIPSGEPGPLAVVSVPTVRFPSAGGEVVQFNDVRFLVNPESEINVLGTDLLNLDDQPTILDIPAQQATFGFLEPFSSVSSADFVQGLPLAPEVIAAGFGEDLAPDIAVASGPLLSTELLGTTVEITDSQGESRLAGLFFVSPGQINYLIPPRTAIGAATVTVRTALGDIIRGDLTISAVSPALYSANAQGNGVAAALFLTVAADGTRTQGLIFDPVTQTPVPIDLGREDQEVFLLLFGTGIRGFTSQVIATVGGQEVPVLGAVPQGEFDGLDQVNIGPIPPSLVGAGEVEIVLIVDDLFTNAVTVLFSSVR